ncbi:MAG: hypothetical protein R3266_14890 [Gemmatimonadota bacterium]|nr:hypothetical protein [Gemmatimonadota bacterium]
MSEARKSHAAETYAQIKAALGDGKWAEMEDAFRSFVEAYPIPDWYVEETIFQGMKLWHEQRPADLLRSFGRVLDRVAGEPVVDAEEVRAIGGLLLEARG